MPLTAGSDRPLITLELSPPKGTDPSAFLQRAKALSGLVDAINIPDCQRSVLKMSSLVAATLVETQTGIETVWQLSCRDRNIIALQADLMGGYALGLRTVLALTGDPVQVGDQKDVAKQVFHLDSLRLLDLLQAMNQGNDATGKALKKSGTNFTVGAALNPFRLSNPAQQARLRQKLEKGISFFQTQPVYHLDAVLRLNDLLDQLCTEVGCIPPKVLIGLIPPRSAQAARTMNQTVVGINIPDTLIQELENAPDPIQSSIEYCATLVEQLRPHCHGFHFMPVGMESRSVQLLEACFQFNRSHSH